MMIKRFTIHLEFHRGYRPRFYIRPQPKPGDRHVDGGVPGILVACKECDGQGLLHKPDRLAKHFPESAEKITNAPPFVKLQLGPESLEYEIGEIVWTRGRDYVVEAIGHQMDGTRSYMILRRKDNVEPS
jgi:hypothetical protein